jgi:hypothetical protein
MSSENQIPLTIRNTSQNSRQSPVSDAAVLLVSVAASAR